MAKRERRSIHLVLGEARRALSMTQEDFGYAVGASHRTAVRWDAGQSDPAEHHLKKLAELLYKEHRALAAEVADFADETLESLGLEAPPRPAPPPPPPPPPPAPLPPSRPLVRPEHLVDALVLAAVEHTGSPPAAVRPLLAAVFQRGAEVGITMEEAARALRVEPAKVARAAEPAKKREA